MRNFLTFDPEDVRGGEVAKSRSLQPKNVDSYFSFSTGEQSKGPNFQEKSNTFKFDSDLFFDSAYFDESQEISNFVLDFDLSDILEQRQDLKRDDPETSLKDNQKITIVNLPSSTQAGTTQSGTGQSSSLIQPTWGNPFNSSIEVEPKVGMNFPVMEIEGAIQRINLNDARSSEEERKQPEANAERDDNSSHSMEEEKKEIKGNTKRGKSEAKKPCKKRNLPALLMVAVKKASKKRNLPGLFMVAVKKAYQYYRGPQRDKRRFELQSIQRVIDDDRNVDDETKRQLDTFIEGCDATLKTYKKCKLYMNQNNNRRVKELFKKFVLRIFKYENEKWLKASGTKNEGFLKELETFSVAFSKHVFGIKVPPR